jgi:hypothetical protein
MTRPSDRGLSGCVSRQLIGEKKLIITKKKKGRSCGSKKLWMRIFDGKKQYNKWNLLEGDEHDSVGREIRCPTPLSLL